MLHAKTTDRARHAAGPTVWTRAVNEIATRAERAGVSRAALLARATLTEADLEDPDSRAPLASLYALLEAMVEMSGDPFVHMRVTHELDFASLDALAFVVITSATFGDGLRAMLRYQRLWSDGERYELEEQETWARLVYSPWGPPRRAHGLMAEMFAVDVVVNAAALTGTPFDVPRVLLAHSPPADPAQHRALLGGVQAEFDQARSEVWFRRADLDLRIARAGQEAVCAFFERHLEERVRALPAQSLAGRTRDLLMRDLTPSGAVRARGTPGTARADGSGRTRSSARAREGARQQTEPDPSVASLARRLHMSPRTLQRRLADEGTSVRELADGARRARAIPLIESGCSIAEVAYLLGFADASAFHRAFRRWTGRTPEAFRRHLAERSG